MTKIIDLTELPADDEPLAFDEGLPPEAQAHIRQLEAETAAAIARRRSSPFAELGRQWFCAECGTESDRPLGSEHPWRCSGLN